MDVVVFVKDLVQRRQAVRDSDIQDEQEAGQPAAHDQRRSQPAARNAEHESHPRTDHYDAGKGLDFPSSAEGLAAGP